MVQFILSVENIFKDNIEEEMSEEKEKSDHNIYAI